MVKALVTFVLLFLVQSTLCKEFDLNAQILEKLEKLEKIYATLEKQLEETRNGLVYLYNETTDSEATFSKEISGESKRALVFQREPVDRAANTTERYTTTSSTTPTIPTTTTSRTTSPVLFHSMLTNSFSVMSPRQIIVYNSVKTNIGGGYDANFGVFKAPVDGLYEFIATASAYNNYFVDVEMVVNNRMLCRAHAASPTIEVGTCVTMVHLVTGDDVFVRHYSGHGTYLYGGYNFPSFSGHLISMDL